MGLRTLRYATIGSSYGSDQEMLQTSGPAKRKLLSVSRSAPLLIHRNDMLAIAGYSVSSPREPLDALVLLQHNDYLAVLIGHSVYADEAEVIADKAKSRGIAAIFVYQGKVDIPEWADLAVNNDSDLPRLLNFLEKQYQRLAG